ncbi:MAG: hypothetical protein MUF51_02905 [Vicinamibacteria bacterium]|jgi:hypothetical protein|nr:hypothetical protein [Vicinamibacteria bacterium]
MTRPRSQTALCATRLLATCGLVGSMLGCAATLEVSIETPMQSKLDVSRFRRLLVGGFVSEATTIDIDLQAETTRLLQNQLRASGKLQVLEADRAPIEEALAQTLENLPEDVRHGRQKEQFRFETDKILQDAAFWKKVGEEFQSPLILTGRLSFEARDQTGFESEEKVVRDPRGRPQVVRGSRYLERKGFSLEAEFLFIDGQTGLVLHKERFAEEVLYDEEQKISPLSSYFELMDRILPNVLGVIAPQRIRGTRILLFK